MKRHILIQAVGILAFTFLLCICQSPEASVNYPVQPWEDWKVNSGSSFGDYRDWAPGYHPGIDLNLSSGANDDLDAPVYAIADGEAFKIDDLGGNGWCVVIKHTSSDQPFIIPARNTPEYQYEQQSEIEIFSVYIHIEPVAKLAGEITKPDGTMVKKDEVIGYIVDPGGGPHLHFEIRSSDARHSNLGSMLLPITNWAPETVDLLFSIGLEFQGDLDNRNFSERLRQQFENNNIQFSQNVTIRIEDEHSKWVVSNEDGSIRYIVKMEGNGLDIYSTKISGHYFDMQDLVASGARHPLDFLQANVGETIIEQDDAPMALIPAGEFQMGDSFNEGNSSERPRHTVYLNDFYIDVHEVTNAQYQKFMDATGHGVPEYWSNSKFNAPDHPVVGVSWFDAVAYAEWAGKRLPTEAEWEKSARGGLVGKRYPWGDEISYDNANYSGTDGKDSWSYTSPVRYFAPNGYGLYDMVGNAGEWCADWYASDYYTSLPYNNPWGADSGYARVLRGGSWYNSPDSLRVAYRSYSSPTFTYPYIGFRCVVQAGAVPDPNSHIVTSVIDLVEPNPAYQHTPVIFKGHGEDSQGHSIIGYEWRSSIDGLIGSVESLAKSDLSVGRHIIYLRVICDDGKWSEEASYELVINSQVQPDTMLASFIDEYLSEKNSPMVGAGIHYAKWGEYFNIDPLFVVAMSGAESSFGKICCDGKYNAWGWMYGGSCWGGFEPGWDLDANQDEFKDAPGFVSGTGIYMETGYEDGIFWVTHNLRKSYFDLGLDTVEEVGRKWCTEGTEDWIRNVNQFLAEMTTGTSLEPRIQVSASSHSFGRIPVEISIDWKLIISNIGGAVLTVNSITSSDPAFIIALPNFPQSISPNNNIEVAVRFSPSSEGSYSGILTVASNDPNEPEVHVSMAGEGISPENRPEEEFWVKVVDTESTLAIRDEQGNVLKRVPDNWMLKVKNTQDKKIDDEHTWWEVEEWRDEPDPVSGWAAKEFLEKVSETEPKPLSPSYPDYLPDKEKVIAWAKEKIGDNDWYRYDPESGKMIGYCLQFVGNAYMFATKGPDGIYPTSGFAYSATECVESLRKQKSFYPGENGWGNPGRGAMIFFAGTTGNKYGHVAIYLGNGRLIHSYSIVQINTMNSNDKDCRFLWDTESRKKDIGEYIGWGYPLESMVPISVGDNVRVTNTGSVGLSIHKDTPTGGIIKVVPDEWVFEVTAGPQRNINGHNWWEIQEQKYESSSIKGWVAMDFLKEVSSDSFVPDSPPDYFASAQERVEKAIQWAESQVGKTDWSEWRPTFVRSAFEGERIEGWDSAEAARQQLEGQGEFYSRAECWNPPRGALMFFSALGEDKPNGHVGIYLGDQGIVHAYDKVRIDREEDGKSKGIVIVQSLANIDSYLGWAYPPEEWFEEVDVASIARLEELINTKLLQMPIYPLYLLDTESFLDQVNTIWLNFAAWILPGNSVDDYDELFCTGIEYDSLRYMSLIRARDFLNAGDITNAKEYLKKADTYEEMSQISFQGATHVFEANLEAARIIAQSIKDGCQASVKFGLQVASPAAAKGADFLYDVLDLGIEYYFGNQEEATKDFLMEQAITLMFNEVPFEKLGGKTASDWIKNRTGKYIFPALTEITKSEEWQHALSEVIKEGVESITEEILIKVTDFVGNEASKAVNSLKAELGSPADIRVYDSQGQVTGLVNGKVLNEIPGSVYDNESVIIFFPTDTYRYEVAGTEEGKYGLKVISTVDGNETSFVATDIPISAKAGHQYVVDWDALSKGENGTTVLVDDDGDGIPEHTVVSGSELTSEEYLSVAGVTPHGRQVITWGELRKTELLQNYPNPFNPDTWIPYALAEQNRVVIKIYTTTGKLVRTLDLGNKSVGVYFSKDRSAHWDGNDDLGEPVASGVYFYTFKAGGFSQIRKMTLLR